MLLYFMLWRSVTIAVSVSWLVGYRFWVLAMGTYGLSYGTYGVMLARRIYSLVGLRLLRAPHGELL